MTNTHELSRLSHDTIPRRDHGGPVATNPRWLCMEQDRLLGQSNQLAELPSSSAVDSESRCLHGVASEQSSLVFSRPIGSRSTLLMLLSGSKTKHICEHNSLWTVLWFVSLCSQAQPTSLRNLGSICSQPLPVVGSTTYPCARSPQVVRVCWMYIGIPNLLIQPSTPFPGFPIS